MSRHRLTVVSCPAVIMRLRGTDAGRLAMNPIDVSSEVFANVFLVLGAVAVGATGMLLRPKAALVLAVVFLAASLGAAVARLSSNYWLPPLVLGGTYILLTAAWRFRPQIDTFLNARRA